MNFKKPKFWKKRYNLFSILLLPFSFLIIILSFIKEKLSTSKKVSIPVICIGNIYIGGTGKTPLSIELIKILKKMNMNPVLVKKFYKDQIDEENLAVSKNIKIIKKNSRLAALKEAERRKFNCIVLDDGYQDYSIHKNLSILCFNEKQLIGNGFTLPAGPLREPLNSVKRSHIIIINGKKNKDFEKKIKSINSKVTFFYSKYTPLNVKKFLNKEILAFAGIGNPENFFDLLKEKKINVKRQISFPDHYNYSKNEIQNLLKISKENNLKLLTTEKDFFRIKKYKFENIDYLSIKVDIINLKKFETEIKRYLK